MFKLKPKTCKAIYVEDNTKCGIPCKGKLYCDKHKCKMDKCDELNLENYGCCPKHQCQFSINEHRWWNGKDERTLGKCRKCIIKGKKVCKYHKCKEDDCFEYVNCHYKAIKYSETSGKEEIICHKFCKGYQCKEKDCQKRKIEEFDYCEDHTCREDDCFKKAILNYYCSYHHRCQFEECTKQCSVDFCKFHTCSECPNRVKVRKTMCTSCIINKAL